MHEHIESRETAQSVTDKKVCFKCPICENKFRTNGELIDHMTDMVAEEKCQFCHYVGLCAPHMQFHSSHNVHDPTLHE